LLEDAAQIDPLNPKTFLSTDTVDVREHSGQSILEMPDAPSQPWITARKGTPAGHVAKTSFKSALLGNERDIYVYTPAGYSEYGKAAGLAVFFDAFGYFDEEATPTPLPAPMILDNLIAAQKIPPVVAVFIGDGPGDARDREFSCNPQLVEFLKSEMLPWVHRQYNVANDPAETVVAGFSLGGLAATYTALKAPELFGNAISMSGALWWAPARSGKPVDSDPESKPEWLARQFIAQPHLPIRLYLDAGSDEDGVGLEGILSSSRHMWDVLLAKGYDVRYDEFDGGHDYLSWREGLADGLIFLLGAPPSKRPAK
jgi:enterochelin esterase family protein